MKDKIAKYLSILKIELEDLEEDIVSLIELTQERTDNKEITPYVGMENITLLRAEFEGIKSVVKSIDSVNVSKYPTLKMFVEDLKVLLKDRIEKSQFPDAVYLFVERKLQKVFQYVMSEF